MAARYLVSGGTGNWGSTTNWSATSGGASGASVPVATDDVFMDANSLGAAIAVTTAQACLSLNTTGYTGTLNITNTLTVSGNVTYGAGMTRSGAGNLAVNASATLTSNGVANPGSLNFNGVTTTITLADNWTVTNLIFANTGAGSPLTINGNTINISGNLIVHTNGNRQTVGTTSLVLNGTGNWTGGSNSGLHLNLTINTAGTITVPATVNLGASVFTYLGGGFNGSTGTLQTRTNCTLNIAGISFLNFTSAAATQTITLTSNLVITGTMSLAVNTTFAGTGVWTAPNLDFSTSTATPRQVTLKAGSVYTITNSMTATQGANLARSVLQSDTPGTQAILTFTNPSVQKIIYVNIIDIDSSLGATGWTIEGTLSNTTNWKVLPTQPSTLSYSS